MESACSSFCHVCIRQLCFLLAGQNVVDWPPLSPSVLGCWKVVTRLSQRVRCTLHLHPNLVFWSTGCFYSSSFILSFCVGIRLPYLHSTCWLNALSSRSVSKITWSSVFCSLLFAIKSECDVFLWHGCFCLKNLPFGTCLSRIYLKTMPLWVCWQRFFYNINDRGSWFKGPMHRVHIID